MIRKYKYTVISLMFAVLFIFGSMTAMNYMLKVRETQLLTERGRVEVESPVRGWEGWGNGDENAVSGDIGGESHVLTTKQVEETIKSWNNRTGVILHDPVAGQISMEEAIENGEGWLAEMGIGEEMDAASFSISAQLGVGGQKEDTGERLEAYFSFWTVTYSNQSMSAILYLNAVTGKVWGAEIKLYAELPGKPCDERLRLFVELAGLQVSDDDSITTDSGGTRTKIAVKESGLYAQEHSYSMSIGFENSYKYIAYQLLIGQN